MPHKRKPNPLSGYTQPYDITSNEKGENRVKATINSNELKMCFDLSYGKTIPDSEMPFISKRLFDDKTTGRHDDQGDSATTVELKQSFGNLPAAYGYLKRVYRDLNKAS